MKTIHFSPIGKIRTPFAELENMPIQPASAKGVKGRVVLDPLFAEGLRDLEGFSHIVVIYHFHRSEGYALTVTPFLDKNPRGLFATRAPRRPNPIGLSVVKLTAVEKNVIHVENVDMLDGTPLLDIKPYIPKFDYCRDVRTGWMDKSAAELADKKSDGRFKTPV